MARLLVLVAALAYANALQLAPFSSPRVVTARRCFSPLLAAVDLKAVKELRALLPEADLKMCKAALEAADGDLEAAKSAIEAEHGAGWAAAAEAKAAEINEGLKAVQALKDEKAQKKFEKEQAKDAAPEPAPAPEPVAVVEEEAPAAPAVATVSVDTRGMNKKDAKRAKARARSA